MVGGAAAAAGTGSGTSIVRLQKELKDCDEAQWERSGVCAVPASADDITRLRGRLKGPAGTPYEGGVFVLDIEVPGGERRPWRRQRLWRCSGGANADVHRPCRRVPV